MFCNPSVLSIILCIFDYLIVNLTFCYFFYPFFIFYEIFTAEDNFLKIYAHSIERIDFRLCENGYLESGLNPGQVLDIPVCEVLIKPFNSGLKLPGLNML